MLRFLAGKLVEAALVCITVSVITFALTHWTGDLAIAIGGMDASKEETERLRSTYGLDRPLVLQYADWAGRALRGDFGTSFFSKEDVFRLILSRLPVTVILAFLSLGLGLAIAVPLGVFAATRPGSWVDRFALSLAVLGQAMPSYWSALLLILLFGVQLQILPISGTDSWLNFVLPTLALGWFVMPVLMRLARAGMIDVLAADFVRRSRQGPAAPGGAVQARAAQRHHARGGGGRSATRVPAWRLDCDRKRVRAERCRPAGMERDPAVGFSGGSGHCADRCLPFRVPEPAGRPNQRLPRSPDPRGMSDVAVAAPAARRKPMNKSLVFGSALLLVFVVAAAFAGVISPHDPYAQSLLRRLRPPIWSGGTWFYPFGTDAFGRDYLSRLLHGTRISLAVGLGGAALAGLIGASLGVVAGYFGGWVDRIVSFVISTRLALPSLLVALAVLQVAGSGLGIVIVVLALTHWDRFAVVMRTVVRQTVRMDFVTRARAMGASNMRIVAQEVMPNVMGQFVVIFTFEMAQCILAAAVLSFLGLGIQAPQPSWGLMMAEGRALLTVNPWLISIAGIALMLLVLAVNLVGDGLRDLLAPKGPQ